MLGLGLRQCCYLDRLRHATRRGTPIGASVIVSELAAKMKRNLALRERGRKRKENAEAASVSKTEPGLVAQELVEHKLIPGCGIVWIPNWYWIPNCEWNLDNAEVATSDC